MIIAVTGRIGAGKGCAADYFANKYGFTKYSTGVIARGILQREGRRGPLPRFDLQQIGFDYKFELMDGVLQNISRDGKSDKIVIDCPRYPPQWGQITEFDSQAYLIAVDAREELRFERLQSRDGLTGPQSWDEFFAQDGRDWVGYLARNGQDVRGCFELAERTFHNNRTKEEFYAQLDEWLRSVQCS